MKDHSKWAALCTLLAFSLAAQAGGYRCLGGAKLSADQRSCSDGGIPVFVADEIQPVQAESVRPLPPAAARGEQGVTMATIRAEPAGQGGGTADGKHEEKKRSQRDSYFYRGWALYVPGATYQVPSGLTDYNRIVVSPGTGILHKLDIRANGTFRWDGKRGRWHPGGECPVVLEKAYEGKDWCVARNEAGGGVYVMDGSTWFQANE